MCWPEAHHLSKLIPKGWDVGLKAHLQGLGPPENPSEQICLVLPGLSLAGDTGTESACNTAQGNTATAVFLCRKKHNFCLSSGDIGVTAALLLSILGEKQAEKGS